MTATVRSSDLIPTPSTWQRVALGALGYNTGVVIASDGSWAMCKTDVGGSYRRTAADAAWTQIEDLAGYPSALRDPENYSSSAGNTKGVWEIAMARSAPGTAYALFKAKVVKTTDSGINWTQTNFAVVGGGSNDLPPNSAPYERLTMNKMVVDPQDPDTVLLGSPTTGVYLTVDGGTTWTQPTGLPDVSGQASGYRLYLFACDEASTVGSGRVWFCFCYGFGLYRSTDNGATWSTAGTGYDTYTHASDIQYVGGEFWIADLDTDVQNVRAWTQGVGWATVSGLPATSFKARYISVNPADADDILISGGGTSDNTMVRSTDGGATWTAKWTGIGGSRTIVSQYVETRAMSYVQDEDGAAANFTWSVAKPAYHPTDGHVYWPSGYGMARSDATATAFTAPNSADPVLIEDYTAGQGELVSMFGMFLSDGAVLLASQDKKIIKMTYPLDYELPRFPMGITLGNGYYVDAVEGDPAKVAWASATDGYSDDAGETGTAFATAPVAGLGGGSILRFDDLRIVRFMGQNQRPRYTTDKGQNWTVPTFTGGTLPADGTTNGFGSGLINFNHRMACKDVDNSGVAYCYNAGEGGSNTMRGIWKSTDYGATWTNQTTSLILTSGQQGGHTTLIHADGVLYLTAGSTGSGYVDETTTNYLFRSTDEGVNWTAVRTSTGFAQEVTEPIQIGLGAPASGSSFKTIWMVGWVDHDLGIWYSTDKGATWTKLGNLPLFDNPTYINGDPNVFGRLLLGGNGTGHWIRA